MKNRFSKTVLLAFVAYVSGVLAGTSTGGSDFLHSVLAVAGIALGLPIGWGAAYLGSEE